MSTHVIGFRPPDAKFDRMLTAYRACQDAGTSIPVEVDDFFGHEPPDEAGVEVAIDTREWSCEGGQGYEVDVRTLPKDVTIIRFYNSW